MTTYNKEHFTKLLEQHTKKRNTDVYNMNHTSIIVYTDYIHLMGHNNDEIFYTHALIYYTTIEYSIIKEDRLRIKTKDGNIHSILLTKGENNAN